MASHVAEGVCCEVLADDRALLRLAELKQTVVAEIDQVKSIRAFYWERLAHVVGGATPADLQSKCVTVALVIASFLQLRTRSQFEQCLFCLSVGDAEANLMIGRRRKANAKFRSMADQTIIF